MPLSQAEMIKRAEKIMEYHKLPPLGAERLHINRGRQLTYELLKDIFGDPYLEVGKRFNGDWEMLFTQHGPEQVMQAIQLQQAVVQQTTADEQQRKVELGILKLAIQTTLQVKALLLDTAAENLNLKKPGDISTQGLIKRLERELGPGPTPPPGERPFTWQAVFEQQGTAGLKAWLDYELKLAEYQLSSSTLEEKPNKINFELRLLQHRVNYLKAALKHL
ncbi:MAG: hypothetical protein RMM17_11540 [Acidobacteriota bacterium]|nr:hypothetical protein [Blastocatellia bacterium]MDW8413305.1 hypothetical protein [Acidobacteriota bacterium]